MKYVFVFRWRFCCMLISPQVDDEVPEESEEKAGSDDDISGDSLIKVPKGKGKAAAKPKAKAKK